MSNATNNPASSSSSLPPVPEHLRAQQAERAKLLIAKAKKPRRSLQVEKLEKPTLPIDIMNDVPDETRNILARSDAHYNEISHLIGDEGRLGNSGYMMFSLLPVEQMAEFGYRLECISDYDYQLVINHFLDITDELNATWIPHWGCAMFKEDVDRQEQWFEQLTLPRVKEYPIHLADALTNFQPAFIEKHIDHFIGENTAAQAAVYLAEKTDLPEETKAKLLWRNDYDAEMLNKARNCLTDKDNIVALTMNNLEAAEEADRAK